MSTQAKLWDCSPRTKAKLEILRHYLGAWFNILAAKGYRHVYYIDGFAGPGKYRSGEDGSPVIAARLASSAAQKFPQFRASLVFIDANPKAIRHLRDLPEVAKHHPNVSIDIKDGTFSEELDQIIAELRANPQSPTFSFIDPFGFGQCPFDRCKLLIHNEHSELFVNFWCGYMNRFKEHRDDQIIEKIRSMVGTDNLREIIDADDSIDAFCQAFYRNLKRLGQYTLRFMMRDEMNTRDNAIFFCGRNAKGFEKIKYAMWQVDPMHGSSFSAHRQPADSRMQGDLFEAGPQTHELSRLIVERYSGRKQVMAEEILQWVTEETDSFLPTHARTELEILFEKGVITSVNDPSGTTRKRARKTWPPRLLLDFAAPATCEGRSSSNQREG